MILNLIKKNSFAILASLAILAMGLLLNAPMKNTFEFDPDEGTNLIKADLYLNGYGLYKQVWSDQPPLFTTLLTFWFRLFGRNVYPARFLSLLFSAGLIWGLYRIIRSSENKQTALAACIFLVLSSGFLPLSLSVMLGIPSLALAIFSLSSASIYARTGRQTWLFSSAAFMSFSVLTKFFGIILAPLIFLEILLSQKDAQLSVTKQKNQARPAFLWLALSLIIYFFIMGMFLYPDFGFFYQQLFKPHMARLNIPNADFTVVLKFIAMDFDIILLAIIAVIFNLSRKNLRLILLPLAWLCLSIIALLTYKPVWYHHYLLVSIPACWLAGIAFGQFLKKIENKEPKTLFFFLTATLVIITATRIPLKFQETLKALNQPAIGEEGKILDLVSQARNNSQWLLTDLPIFAFNSRILVPPETAVLTLKRLPTETNIKLVLEKYKPEMILLGRFTDYDQGMLSMIQNNYHKEAEISIRRPITNTVCLWQPISTFLPSQMQLSVGKRLNESKRNFKIPIVKRIDYFYYQKITLYVLKTDSGQF